MANSLRKYARIGRKKYKNVMARRRAHECWRRLADEHEIKLELGSGPRRGDNGWTTVDTAAGADIVDDVQTGIPLPDDCVKEIYCSHFFEHFRYDRLLILLRECARILTPGGSLSAAVPNTRHYISAYMERRQCLSSERMYRPAIVDTGSYIDQVNYIAYMGGHHAYLFDEENLVNTLKRGGFKEVSLRDFDPSMDLAKRDFESIYAIAYKGI